MITISTGGIGPMDITAGARGNSKGVSKEEEKAMDAFASLMNMVSTKQEQSELVTAADELDVTEVAPAKDTTKDYDIYKESEDIDNVTDQVDGSQNEAVKEESQVNDVKETEVNADDDQKLDDTAKLIGEVKEAIKDALGITDEELDGILEEMGIELTELLLGDNLKNFILQAQGATNVDLLVNENLANLVNELSAKVSELINQYGFTDDAEFEQFIADNLEAIESVIQENTENVDVVSVDKTEIKANNINEHNVPSSEDEVDTKNLKAENKSDSNSSDNALADKMVVKSTTESGQSMTENQSMEQSNQQIATSFNQAIDNTVNANVNVNASTFTSNIQQADIIRQIIEQLKVTVSREVQSMEIQLNPESLGKVYVNVEAKDGIMQAKIIAETETAKQAIENNIAILKENFSNNELKVEAIEVMVAAYGFFEESTNGDFHKEEQANDTSKAIGGINVNDLDEEELTEEEELEVEIMKSKGNTVSYTV